MKGIKISSGENGNIYKIRVRGAEFVRKYTTIQDPTEFNIQKKLYRHFPTFILRPYRYKKLEKVSYVNMNYALGSPITRQTPAIIRVTLQVLLFLKKSVALYPSFRHNDLHTRNVMVSPTGDVKIIDFGFSNIETVGCRNPRVQNLVYKKSWGIYPKNDTRYDAHFFLNSLSRVHPEIVKRLLPKEYIGDTSTKILNGRLRYNVSHTKLPTLDEIIFSLLFK